MSPSADAKPGSVAVTGNDGKLSVTLMPAGIDAATVGGVAASATPAAGKLLALDGNAKVPPAALPDALTLSTLNGKAIADYALKADSFKPPTSGTPTPLDTDGDGIIDFGVLPVFGYQPFYVSRAMAYYEPGATYCCVPVRSQKFVKKAGSSWLKITLHDNFGYNMNGTHSNALAVRIKIDNQQVGWLGSHAPSGASGWRLWNQTMTFWVPPGLDAGEHEAIVEVAKWDGASQVMIGWNTADNFLLIEEKADASRFAVKNGLGDAGDLSSTSWTSATNRGLSYTKKEGGTDLLISWTDVLGLYYQTHNTACRFRLTMDGSQVGRHHSYHTDAVGGWQMNPMQQNWMLQNIAAGTHFFQIEYYRESGTDRCRLGWWTDNNNMSVEELPTTGRKVAVNLPGHNPTDSNWHDLNGASITYTKAKANSALRITYHDGGFGFHQTSHNTSLGMRVLVDGNHTGRYHYAHSRSTGSGWILGSYQAEWWLEGISTGEHAIKVQWHRAGGASELLSQWHTGEKFLEVREYER